MAYHRGAVLTGQSISLRIVFTDAAGNLVDPDAVPDLYIYDPTVDSTTITLEVDARTYASAASGPVVSTRLSTGYYSYEYTVPTGSAEGLWRDVWVCEIDTAFVSETFSFTVTVGASLSDQSIGKNTMLVVELDSTITNTAGDQFLDYTKLYYTTVYSPLYASPDLMRLEVGKWIDWIPDDTLALMIHWASQEADFIQGAIPSSQANLQLAQTKFVVYDAAYRALMIPGQGSVAGSTGQKSKSLGDLSIKNGKGETVADASTLAWIKQCREEWFRVLNAGGNIVPGQGLNPTYAVKGGSDPDRNRRGRQWASPSEYPYAVPTANTWVRREGQRRSKKAFGDRFSRGSRNNHYED
jgi:hypothetical protein